DASTRALGRFRQRDHHVGGNIVPEWRFVEVVRVELRTPPTLCRSGPGAEHVFDDVLKGAAGSTAAAARPPKTLGSPGEGLKGALAIKPTGSRTLTAEALEAMEARLAFGIDLATIKRFALILVADDFVRGIELGKTGRSFRIVLVGVRMQLL